MKNVIVQLKSNMKTYALKQCDFDKGLFVDTEGKKIKHEDILCFTIPASEMKPKAKKQAKVKDEEQE